MSGKLSSAGGVAGETHGPAGCNQGPCFPALSRPAGGNTGSDEVCVGSGPVPETRMVLVQCDVSEVDFGGTSWAATDKCWGQICDMIEIEGDACGVILSFPGPLLNVQCAEYEGNPVPSLPRVPQVLFSAYISCCLVLSRRDGGFVVLKRYKCLASGLHVGQHCTVLVVQLAV